MLVNIPVNLPSFSPPPLSTVDALFAVYEASSWELWSFMEYNALNGAPRSLLFPVVFYVAMVFFLVVIVQVCSVTQKFLVEVEQEQNFLTIPQSLVWPIH